jgi:hypothetical protein
MKKVQILIVVSLLLSACAPIMGCSGLRAGEKCTRVFFIGNSYTTVNNLPEVFTGLSTAGGHKVETGLAASGGWRLADAAASKDTLNGLASKKWDYVILQEQSQVPASTESRNMFMIPAIRELTGLIYPSGAVPILFIPWGHRDGWPDNGLPDYASMQNAIDDGYMEIARDMKITVASVGYAWQSARSQYPLLDLWQADGSHPTRAGTYLAACVFYAVIFNQSPEGLDYYGRVNKSSAMILQKIAADTVLNNSGQWKLP